MWSLWGAFSLFVTSFAGLLTRFNIFFFSLASPSSLSDPSPSGGSSHRSSSRGVTTTMGRADLSRHRGTHSSESRQTPLPPYTQALLQTITTYPDRPLSEAASSLLHSSTQRQQQTAIKALCATLPTSHTDHAVGEALASIMLLPHATNGLVSAALRGCLRTRVPDNVQQAFDHVYARLGEVHQFPCAVADMRLTAALLSESDTRDGILVHHTRIERVIAHICHLVDLYLKAASADGNEAYDARLLPDACDSAMKAAQDLLNALHTRTDSLHDVSPLVNACERVLGLEFVPRSCALACGVAYVTGRVLRSRSGTTADVVDVTTDILGCVTSFPPFSRLALLRALMEAPAARPTLPEILFPHERSGSVFDSLAGIVTANADVHLRFLAMDTLIACIRRCDPLPVRCRDVVLGLIYERWQEPFPGVASQIRESVEALVATDRGDEDTPFWTSLAARLAGGDWRVKGMHAPLGVLVKRIGARSMLGVREDCQRLALGAVAADYRLVKHAADWLGCFWKVLRNEVTFDEFLGITGETLVEGLVDTNDRTLGGRVAEHVLPIYFRSVHKGEVGECANGLLTCLAGMKSSSRETRARGTVNILSVARKNGVFVASFADPEIYALLQSALGSAEEDVRSSALDLIVTCRVPTEPVLQQELDLVVGYLPCALMPGGSLADRSRFRHCMRRLFERLAACRHAARDGSGGWWMRVRKERFGGLRTREFEEMKVSLLERIKRFELRVLSVLLASCYPGAVFSRRSSALEVLELQSRNLGFGAAEVGKAALESVVAGVLACLIDEWERPRRAALQVISTLDAPVPGLDDHARVTKLQTFAMSLLYSPKQKEVDAGASLMRAVFRKYVLYEGNTSDGHPMPIPNGIIHAELIQNGDFGGLLGKGEGQGECHVAHAPNRGLTYARIVLTSLKDAIKKAESDFTGACRRGLFHGPFLLLRCIFQDLKWKTFPIDKSRSSLTSFVNEVVEVAWKSTQIAMRGVSFKAFEEYLTEVDGFEEEEDLVDEDDILLKEKRQLESTACFQSLKEICIALGILCHEVPLGLSMENEGEWQCLMEEKHIRKVGNVFLHIFQNTRHWGVLDGASEGFQLLCENLLRTSSCSLRSLPQKWARETIRLALNEGLYVLRRSAGVPALINAIVNAEGNCNRRSYESPLLHETCSTLLNHLENSAMFKEERLLGKQRSREEESVAHSLNLLRSLFLNGNVATTILRHLERAAICCLEAFRSASWLIRNSAMMLFSALVRRGIGVCAERKAEHATSSFDAAGGTSATLEGEPRMRGTTAFQFFSRHPKLHPFLFNTLQESAKQLESGAPSDHAALYPALYLLSCLSPAAADDPSTTISMKPFRSILRQCTHWRSDYVRRVAAAAYVPILEDPSHVAKAVKEILSEVPTEPDKTVPGMIQMSPRSSENAVVGDACSPVGRTRRLSQNSLHGDLLTVTGILNRTRDIMSLEDMCDTVGVLSDLLPTRIWIAGNGEKNPCSYTRGAFVSVVSAGYLIAQEVKKRQSSCSNRSGEADALLALCANLGRILVDFPDRACGFGAPVGMTSLCRQAAQFLVTKDVTAIEEGEASFVTSLQTHLIQVKSANRDSVLSGVESCVAIVSTQMLKTKWSGISEHETQSVREAVGSLWQWSRGILHNKDDQELIVGVLRLLIALLGSSHEIPSVDSHVVWDWTQTEIQRVTEWSQSHPCVDIREYALILLGRLVSDGACSREAIAQWMNATEAACAAHATTTRMASCTSVALSGLAQTAMKGDVERDIAARGFLVFSRMLEDDHADVRRHALRVVQQYISPSVLTEDLSLNVLPSLMKIYRRLGVDFRDCESVLATLLKQLGKPSVPGCYEKDMLVQAVARMVGCKPFVTVSPNKDVCSSEDLVNVDPRKDPSRLFRLEDEVDDGEPVLRLQLMTYCFRDVILSRQSDLLAPSFLREMFELLISDLKKELDEHVSTEECTANFGPSFTKKGFLSCLRLMLRVLLGMCCLCATDLPQGMGDSFRTAADRFRSVCENSCHVLHPVLLNVLDGLCTILTKGCSEKAIRATPGILFLLSS